MPASAARHEDLDGPPLVRAAFPRRGALGALDQPLLKPSEVEAVREASAEARLGRREPGIAKRLREEVEPLALDPLDHLPDHRIGRRREQTHVRVLFLLELGRGDHQAMQALGRVGDLARLLNRGTLAGPRDEIWPIERWPNDPIGFDRPLGVGARGGHGAIRYTVVAYEPGRLIAFEFEPGSGLRGGHRLEVEPAGDGTSRLRHVLDVELEGVYRVLRPVFVAMHDALVEDLHDKAELAATAKVAHPARWPRWLRAANRIELALRPRRGRLAADGRGPT